MKTPSQIMDLIRDDAPCVNHILHELHIGSPEALDDDDIDSYYDHHPDLKPTDSQLLEILENYSWDNNDAHYWSGRYAQMKMDSIDTAMEVWKIMDKLIMGSIPTIVETVAKSMTDNLPIIRVPFTESDADDIRAWGSFLWNFWGRQLFLFNTDEDPDAEEGYDPI